MVEETHMGIATNLETEIHHIHQDTATNCLVPIVQKGV